jgi:energy-coupling factor transporter ATP-binding protein EcfA2
MPLAQIIASQALPDYGILHQEEFLDEFEYRYRPGQHVILLGPTGRGKTTLIGKMLSHGTMPKTKGLITIQNGPDPALAHLGKPTKTWPPSIPVALLMYDEKPLIRRYQALPKKPEHFPMVRRQSARILRWMFAREDWTLVMPDLQLLTDPGMLGLGKDVDQLIITLRKRRSSVWMDAQAPRWIPRSSNDQTSHILIWKVRDMATIRRLREIAGVDMDFIQELFAEFKVVQAPDGTRKSFDCLWIDVGADEYYIVRGK